MNSCFKMQLARSSTAFSNTVYDVDAKNLSHWQITAIKSFFILFFELLVLELRSFTLGTRCHLGNS